MSMGLGERAGDSAGRSADRCARAGGWRTSQACGAAASAAMASNGAFRRRCGCAPRIPPSRGPLVWQACSSASDLGPRVGTRLLHSWLRDCFKHWPPRAPSHTRSAPGSHERRREALGIHRGDCGGQAQRPQPRDDAPRVRRPRVTRAAAIGPEPGGGSGRALDGPALLACPASNKSRLLCVRVRAAAWAVACGSPTGQPWAFQRSPLVVARALPSQSVDLEP